MKRKKGQITLWIAAGILVLGGIQHITGKQISLPLTLEGPTALLAFIAVVVIVGFLILKDAAVVVKSQRPIAEQLAEVEVDSTIDVHTADETGFTPLMNAVEQNDLEQVLQLVKMGADVNAQDQFGKTALYYANLMDRPHIVASLEQAGGHK